MFFLVHCVKEMGILQFLSTDFIMLLFSSTKVLYVIIGVYCTVSCVFSLPCVWTLDGGAFGFS